MTSNIKPVLGVGFALLLAHACQPLDEIADDVCGNKVVEPELGEDCDELTSTCYPPGHLHQCRYACEESDTCPEGHRCGVDQVCRAPAGQLTLARAESDEALSLTVGDFDADGRVDVVRGEIDRVVVEFFGPELALEDTLAIRRSTTNVPAVADLDGLAGDDLVLSAAVGEGQVAGVAAYLSDGRALMPNPFSAIELAATTIRATRTDGVWPPTDDEILALVDTPVGALFSGISTRGDVATIGFTTPITLPATDTVVGMVAVEAPAGCDWVAVAVAGASSVLLVRPCKIFEPAATYSWDSEGAEWMDLPLGADAVIPSLDAEGAALLEPVAGVDIVFSGDYDDDGLADIAVAVQREETLVLDVFYQIAEGAWVPPDPALPEMPTCGLPLAVADVNGDHRPDVAGRNGYVVSLPKGEWLVQCGHAWSRAAVGDFDGSGRLDFVGARRGDPGPTTGFDVLFTHESGALTRDTLDTENTVRFLAVGNFDGDAADDIAYVERTSELSDEISAVFGQSTGGIGAPQSLGTLPPIVQMTAGRTNGGDAASELLALSEGDGALSAAIFIGSSARELVAPYLILIGEDASPDPGEPTKVEMMAGGSFDEGASLAILTSDVMLSPGQLPLRRLVMPATAEGALFGPPLLGAFAPGTPNRSLSCWTNENCGGGSSAMIVSVPRGDGTDTLWSLFGSAQGTRLCEHTADAGWSGGEGNCSTLPEEAYWPGTPFGSLRDAHWLGDVDGDGLDDVLVLTFDGAGMTARTEAMVLFNQNGAIDLARSLRIQSTGSHLETATLMQLDRDPELEIVVTFMSRCQGDPNCACKEPIDCVRLVRFDFAPGLEVVDESAGVVLLDNRAPGEGVAERQLPVIPRTLAAGDFDGDGIDDLVLGWFDGHAFYRGVAERP